MATIQELLAEKADADERSARLAARLEAARAEAKADSIQSIKAQMSELGITAADLGIVATPARRKRATVISQAPHPSKGKPVPAKYRNQATGETWSGRGLQPKWLREAVEAGANKDDFAVAA